MEKRYKNFIDPKSLGSKIFPHQKFVVKKLFYPQNLWNEKYFNLEVLWDKRNDHMIIYRTSI